MSLHASEDVRNVTRTILARVAALALPSGCAVVPADDTRFDSQDVSAFVRVQVEHAEGTFAGVTSGRKMGRHLIEVRAECWAILPEGSSSGALDTVDQVASIVRAGLTYADLTLLDYVSDPSGATAAGGVLRFIRPPELQTIPPLAPWARRLVYVTGHWWPQHEA